MVTRQYKIIYEYTKNAKNTPKHDVDHRHIPTTQQTTHHTLTGAQTSMCRP